VGGECISANCAFLKKSNCTAVALAQAKDGFVVERMDATANWLEELCGSYSLVGVNELPFTDNRFSVRDLPFLGCEESDMTSFYGSGKPSNGNIHGSTRNKTRRRMTSIKRKSHETHTIGQTSRGKCRPFKYTNAPIVQVDRAEPAAEQITNADKKHSRSHTTLLTRSSCYPQIGFDDCFAEMTRRSLAKGCWPLGEVLGHPMPSKL
jgi:hypothetical protein